jgi:cyclic 2,3-diphosphoglycerate synthase
MATGAIALIDGEHHPDAVRDAIAYVSERVPVRAALFCGGEEKLSGELLADPECAYGVPVTVGGEDLGADLRRLLAEHGDVDEVIDLADEPVLEPAAKYALATAALDAGLRFVGADFELRPVPRERLDFDGPVVVVCGTGKRTGKTAVAGHWARLLRDAGESPLIVSMGRGGPAEPQLASPDTALPELLAIARAGRHAASDYLEDAVLAGVPAVGCRRVGGGLGGGTAHTTLSGGLALALAQDPGALLIEGSGAVIPPVAANATVVVVGSREGSLEGLGPIRLLRADLVLVTHEDRELAAEIAAVAPVPVVRIELVPEPAEPIDPAARVAFFSTGTALPPGVDVVISSPNLARRGLLGLDLQRAESERCDVYLTELKAAAVDTVAEAAERTGARVVFARNVPRARMGEPDLDDALLSLYNRSRMSGVPS